MLKSRTRFSHFCNWSRVHVSRGGPISMGLKNSHFPSWGQIRAGAMLRGPPPRSEEIRVKLSLVPREWLTNTALRPRQRYPHLYRLPKLVAQIEILGPLTRVLDLSSIGKSIRGIDLLDRKKLNFRAGNKRGWSLVKNTVLIIFFVSKGFTYSLLANALQHLKFGKPLQTYCV